MMWRLYLDNTFSCFFPFRIGNLIWGNCTRKYRTWLSVHVLSCINMAHGSPHSIVLYCNVFADDQTETSPNSPEVQDKATQRFDLEGLMVQLNVIVKSGKLKDLGYPENRCFTSQLIMRYCRTRDINFKSEVTERNRISSEMGHMHIHLLSKPMEIPSFSHV